MNLSGVPYTDEGMMDYHPPPPPPPVVPPMTHVPSTQPSYPDSVPATPVVGSQPANTYLGPYQPTPAPTSVPYTPQPDVAVPYLVGAAGVGQVQGFSEPGYLSVLGMKRKDVQKLVILSLMVTLGIAVHWVTVNYYDGWLSSWGLTGRQDFLLRVSYPLAIVFVMWNLKAFGMSKTVID
eukprot:jgi/Tetstr1/447218/TSEL_034655.t1